MSRVESRKVDQAAFGATIKPGTKLLTTEKEYNKLRRYGRHVLKATITTRVGIAANRTLVFEYLTNLKYHYLWNPHLRSISGGGALKLGSTYNSVSLILGIKIRGLNEVTKFEPLQELEIQNNIGAVHYRARYQITDWDKKTKVTCTTTVSTNGSAFVFTVPILKTLARRELQTDMQALKVAIENRLG